MTMEMKRRYSRTRKSIDSRDWRRDGRIGQHQLLETHRNSKSTVKSETIPVEVTLPPKWEIDGMIIVEDSSTRSSGNDELINEIKHHSKRGKLNLAFRPHPIKKEGRFLSLPKPTESIKLYRLVYLDGRQDNFIEGNGVDLIDLPTNNTDKVGDASEDGNEVQRSQTVVWDDDEHCVPMSEWQTTVHPSCNSLHELDIASLINDAALSLVSSKGYWRNAWKVDLSTYEENEIAGFSTPWSRLNSSSKKDAKAVTSHVVLKSLK